MRAISLFFAGLLTFALLSPCARANGKYVWPLTKRLGLSSVFGEYRAARLHTGLDLKTAMVTGLSVRAIADGVIYRLSVRYRGFGKALYIRHPDGLVSVYGHLDEFENRRLGLENIVSAKRKESGERYPGDIFISVRVRKGQSIGYSGETGYGLPHLHFELRRGETEPINPLSIFKQKDNSAPVIKRLIIRPLGPDSLAEGRHGDLVIWLKDANGGYRSSKAPRVSGKFLVLANAFDTIDADNHCGVHKIALWLDNELVYSMCFDKLDYGSSFYRGGLVFDHKYAYFPPSSYVYNLHNRYGVADPWTITCKDRGILDLSSEPGLHTLTVKAWDDAANCSTATAQVKSARQQPRQTRPQEAFLIKEHSKQAPLVQVWDDFAEVWVPIPKAATSDVPRAVLLTANAASGQRLRLKPVERCLGWLSANIPVDGRLRGPITISISSATQGNAIAPRTLDSAVQIVPKAGGVLEMNGLRVELPADALYSDQVFKVISVPAKELPGVPIVSQLVRKVVPEGIPLDKEVFVSFECPGQMPQEDVVRCGLYEYNNKTSKWKYRGNARKGDSSVGYGVRYLSTFGLLVDRAGPKIELLEPKPGARLGRRGNRLVARITDVGSGIDYRAVVATIDGVEIDAEYDPDRKLLKGKFNLSRARGAHKLSIRASDKAGNPAKPLDVTLHGGPPLP
ncbi:MAG TPA: peptidoglycan DD-metalloendopeptidase family protein [bacterium]|nr:peptidoglycan DD-metalloendopeptidase family protein [bacterium]